MNTSFAENLTSGLYLIATPIGNLGDITFRALETLKNVDAILCEDTRVTRKLLSAYDIRAPLHIYNDYTDDTARGKILAKLKDGQKLALVSDAGMPLISDPGYKLVQACYKENISVTSLPGANAVLTAVQLSGLPSEPFMFLGFLPPKSAARQNDLKKWKDISATLVFYEAKQRVLKTLEDCAHILGKRDIAVIRELTKKFEEVMTGSIKEVVNELSARKELKGEFVIVIGPPPDKEYNEEELKTEILKRLKKDDSVKTVSTDMAQEYGLSKTGIYDLAKTLKP